MKLFTIGYEKRDISEFINTLLNNRIESLVDIRAVPHSRNRNYTKANLERMLNERGIEYLLKNDLGSEKEIRDKVKSDGDYDYFFSRYEEYLKRRKASMQELAALAENKSICLLCYEEDFNRCHRRSVAAALAKSRGGCEIVHL
jgi:uncharacterized protein (DUF488 family)